MAQKQGILGRIAQLAKANINALIDQAEDPEKMLDQLIRDYTNNIAEAKDATAQTIGTLRMLEQDKAEDEKSVAEWGQKAAAASSKAEALKSEGKTAEADKFDQLAKFALQRQMQHEREIKDAEPQIEAQTQVVERLKAGLNQMESKLEQMRSKRDELVARAKAAHAQNQVSDALGAIDVLDPTSELSRFEEKVRREEAMVTGRNELAASSLDAQFESLEAASDDLELEARLQALKSGSAGQIGSS